MGHPLKILPASSAGEALWLFEGLPELPAASLRLVCRVTSSWRHVLGERNFFELLDGLFQRYCKVREVNPPELVVKRSGETQTRINVAASPFSIGRKRENNLTLPEPGVSGIHARLVLDADHWALRDEGSVNGTLLNGKLIEKRLLYPLKHGDVIAIMGHEIVIRMPEPTLRPPRFDLSFQALEESTDMTLGLNCTSFRLGVQGTDFCVDVQVPTGLVRCWLQSLVGMHYASDQVDARLSDVERGLYEFLVLKFIQQIHESACEPGGGLFYLAGIDADPAPEQPIVPRVAARFFCRFEETSGDIRLLLPCPLMEEWPEQLRIPSDGDSAGSGAILRSQIHTWRWLNFPVVVKVAAIQLSPAELMSLDPGDVVLLPKDSLTMDGTGNLSGTASLLFNSTHPLRGSVTLGVAEGVYQLTFEKFNETHPQEAQMDESQQENQPEPGDNLEVAGEMVKDLSLTLVVELDRLNLTLEELTRLLPGQVLQLNRSPTEPVAFSVDGRIIGRGQLVKIKDDLGVKILTLKK